MCWLFTWQLEPAQFTASMTSCPAPAPMTYCPAPATLLADTDPVLALLGVAALASTLPGAGPLTQATSVML